MEEKKLVIIDSNSIIHRAYHALPPLTTKKGELVNAVYGFLLVFFKAIKDFRPDFIAACFDFPALTFRHKKFKGYKAKRPPAPEELYRQIPKVKEVLKSFSVPIFEKEGFEADDLIGTIAKLASKKQVMPNVAEALPHLPPSSASPRSAIEIIILSGDLDTLQLVNSQTKVYILKRGVKEAVLYDEKLVKEKFRGIKSEQLLDFKALRGDPSDNIPGVTGIGEKTAIDLLKKFETIENLYQELTENTEKAKKLKPKIKELLLQQKEQAFLSKSLAEIKKNVSVDFNLKNCCWKKYDKQKIVGLLKRLEFHSLVGRLSETGKQTEKNSSIVKNLKLW